MIDGASRSEDNTPARWPRLLIVCVLALLLLGVTWRTARYLLQFPIWGDEAHICLNILDRDYVGLTQPLRFVQAAPILFLWLERTALLWLGASELSLRLLSLLGGLGGLLLFWRLARSALPPLAAALAVGILAVSYYPVRHSCEVKPYGVDLLAAAGLLVLALHWLRQPQRLLWPLLLTLLVPLAIGLSYPAVFIAGTVSLALLPIVVRQPRWKTRALFAAYNAALLATFVGMYFLVGAGQYESEGGQGNYFYSEWFPPAQPWPLLQWLVAVHTGNLLAYPVGGHTGGSTVTALLCVLGAWQLGRSRQWPLCVLCLGPFALTFLAAALHRYPYGGSARYEQHLAPSICLLAGNGAAAIINWAARSETAWRRAVVTTFVLLAGLGLVGLGRDLVKPYKTDGDLQVRQVLLHVVQAAGPDDQVVVMDPLAYTAPTIEWYLRLQGEHIAWDGRIDWERLRAGTGQMWNVYFSRDATRPVKLAAEFPRRAAGRLVLVEHSEHSLQMGWSWDQETRRYCELYHWRCAGAKGRLQ